MGRALPSDDTVGVPALTGLLASVGMNYELMALLHIEVQVYHDEGHLWDDHLPQVLKGPRKGQCDLVL